MPLLSPSAETSENLSCCMPRLMQTSSFKAIQTNSDGLQPAVASNQQLQGNATKTHFLQRVAKGRTHQRRHAKSFALQVFSFHVSDYLFAREPPQATNHASCFKRLPEKGRLYITVGNTLHVRRYRTHDPCSVQCEFGDTRLSFHALLHSVDR